MSSATTDVEQVNSHTLLMGSQNGTATLENRFAVSYNAIA